MVWKERKMVPKEWDFRKKVKKNKQRISLDAEHEDTS